MTLTKVKSSFLLGIDPVPAWARGNRKIVFMLADARSEEPRVSKAFVETARGAVVANPGDRIVLTYEDGLKVFPRGPLEAA